jgi:hypothetical protein
MLPDRSKRYAGIDGTITRLNLALNWQLALVALLVLALLAAIFPRKVLVERLYAQETLDELTLSYIENLFRADSRNADAAVLLSKAQQNELDIQTLEARLLPLIDTGDARQRTESWLMLIHAYDKALAAKPDAWERKRLRAQLADMLQKAAKIKIPEPLARLFSASAFELGQPQLGLDFLTQIETGHSAKTLEKYGRESLARGEYGLASEYFLMARDHAVDLEDARRLFQIGVSTLMADSRFKQAMASARLHAGPLDNDPVTLRYLVLAAQAAGESALVADYARRLVYQGSPDQRAP